MATLQFPFSSGLVPPSFSPVCLYPKAIAGALKWPSKRGESSDSSSVLTEHNDDMQWKPDLETVRAMGFVSQRQQQQVVETETWAVDRAGRLSFFFIYFIVAKHLAASPAGQDD